MIDTQHGIEINIIKKKWETNCKNKIIRRGKYEKIIVISCDKNEDLFKPFYHCIEKYWPNHPEIVYSTESVVNPFYKNYFHLIMI